MFSPRRIQPSRNFLLLLSLFIFVCFVFLWWPWPFYSKNSVLKSERCLVYSPAYPSAGGAGCSPKCTKKNGQKTWSSGALYRNNDWQKWPQDLEYNMNRAASILKTFGNPRRLDTENGRQLHVSFDYYCCYTAEEHIKIGKFINSYSWTPHEVRFDKMECAIHGYNDFVSLVLMVDSKSQEQLTRLALKNELDLETTTGIRKHIPHTRLQNFHMTLGIVNQSDFPVQSAVAEINKQIPPGSWHKSPIILKRPDCNKCDKLMKRKNVRGK